NSHFSTSLPLVSNNQLRINGTFDNLTMALNSKNAYLNSKANILFSDNQLKLHFQSTQNKQIDLNGNVLINWQPNLHWTIAINSQKLNLKTLNPNWPQ